MLSFNVCSIVFTLLDWACRQSFLLIMEKSFARNPSFDTFSVHKISTILRFSTTISFKSLQLLFFRAETVRVSHPYDVTLHTYVWMKFFIETRFILLEVRRLFLQREILLSISLSLLPSSVALLPT